MGNTPGASVRVLVVDDNDDMRNSTRLLLRRAGFEVETAANGAEAMRVQEARPSHLLLTDLLMPEADGIETIEHFRRHYPLVRIVAMSGGGLRVRGEQYLATAEVLGADAVLRKPIASAELVATLRNLAEGL